MLDKDAYQQRVNTCEHENHFTKSTRIQWTTDVY